MEDSTAPVGQAAEASVIRDVCQQNQENPEVIWDVLAGKGIDATPGTIAQALSRPDEAHAPKPSDGAGLTPEELAVVSALAAKAGGVNQMVSSLLAWQEGPK